MNMHAQDITSTSTYNHDRDHRTDGVTQIVFGVQDFESIEIRMVSKMKELVPRLNCVQCETSFEFDQFFDNRHSCMYENSQNPIVEYDHFTRQIGLIED